MHDLSELQKVLGYIASQMGLYKENLKFLSSCLAFLGYIPHPAVIALLLPNIFISQKPDKVLAPSL